MNILLDYLFPISAIEPIPQASTGFLKSALVVGLPKDGTVTPDVITLATTMTQVNATFGATAAAEVQQLFNAGLTRVYLLPTADLDIAATLVGHEADFYSMLISSDFADAAVTAAAFGTFTGVIGVSSTDDTFLGVQAAIANRSAWHTTFGNKAKNMFYAFGKLLANPLNWRNQQYISMPFADDVDTLGEANTLFDARINFVISDDEFSNRLALFVAGGKAITAPYVKRNLQIDMQSRALSYIGANQPGYTLKQAALLEDELTKVIASYIDKQWLDAGEVEVTLEQENFVAGGTINIAEPKALWRIFAEMRATL